ncbi:MAG: polysaccharide biosynthesis/export family protein [Balneolaceae bacterium]
MREKLQPSIYILFIICFMVMVQACSSSRDLSTESGGELSEQPISPISTEDSSYKIRPGDEIEILVWEQPSFNTLTTVSRMGTIAIPLLGEISVAGLTQDELERDLHRQLEEYVRGEILLTVAIRNTDSMIVSVIGMVSSPDNYSVADQISIFRIIATAGGHTDMADLSKVKLYRQSTPESYVQLDLLDYLETGRMNSDELMVRPGDIVYVPEKENVVREMSEFLRDVVVLFGIFRVFR